LPYSKEFDRAEWASLCEYLATPSSPSSDPNDHSEVVPPISLRSLHLNIISGKPDHGWDAISPIMPSDFDTMLRMKNEWLGGNGDFGGVDLEWAEQLMTIKGLQEINVKAMVERCASPVSEKQAFWIAFSKSVDEGRFGEWVRGRMVR
jgi:hypothetical protein